MHQAFSRRWHGGTRPTPGLGVNELYSEEWDASFGRVYKNHIDNGVEMIMAGHFVLPEYQKKLNPKLADKDLLPATLSEELIQGLLKGQLDFNGMVITEERMNDAVRRVLGIKAKLNLHKKKEAGTLLKTEKDLEVVGCAEHLRMRADAADKGITLVKNTFDQLPIRPETHKRIRLYFLQGETHGIYAAGSKVLDDIVAELERRGFVVTVNDGTTRVKGPTLKYRKEVDAALIFADVIGYGAENNYRIRWKVAMSNECPWYVHEVPTVFVSLNYTTHLHDATMVKCYINAYHSNVENIKQVIDKIMSESEFKGTPNNLVWAEKWQAKL